MIQVTSVCFRCHVRKIQMQANLPLVCFILEKCRCWQMSHLICVLSNYWCRQHLALIIICLDVKIQIQNNKATNICIMRHKISSWGWGREGACARTHAHTHQDVGNTLLSYWYACRWFVIEIQILMWDVVNLMVRCMPTDFSFLFFSETCSSFVSHLRGD